MLDFDAAEVGRNIGWDMAMYGQVPPSDAPLHIVAGYKAGLASFTHPLQQEDEHIPQQQLAIAAPFVISIVQPHHV